jgi:hypothetical protein
VINLKEDDYLSVTLLGRFGGDFGGITYINRLYARFWSKSSTSDVSYCSLDRFGWKQIIRYFIPLFFKNFNSFNNDNIKEMIQWKHKSQIGTAYFHPQRYDI